MKIYSYQEEDFNQMFPDLYKEVVDLIAIDVCDLDFDPDHLGLLPGDMAFIPLYLLPFYNKSRLWVIAALLERRAHGIGIDQSRSTVGQPLWLPDHAQINTTAPSIEAQVKALREDVAFLSQRAEDQIELMQYWSSVNENNIRVIHPSELVPLPGSNTMAIVCLATDTSLRKRLIAYHHSDTAELTNIERKIGQALSRNSGDVAVSCSKDNSGRFHLYVQVLRNQTLHSCQTVQATWAGLVDHAVSHLSTRF